jgi:hypothetical protein
LPGQDGTTEINLPIQHLIREMQQFHPGKQSLRLGSQIGQKGVSVANLLKLDERLEFRGVGSAFVSDTYEMVKSDKSPNGALAVDEYELATVVPAMGS